MVDISRLLNRQFADGICHFIFIKLNDVRIGLVNFDAKVAHRRNIGFRKGGWNATGVGTSITQDRHASYLRIAKIMSIGIPFH